MLCRRKRNENCYCNNGKCYTRRDTLSAHSKNRSMNFHNIHRSRVKHQYETKASCRRIRFEICVSLGSLYNVESYVANLIKGYMIRFWTKTR